MSTEYPQPQKGYHTDVPFQSFSESVQSDSDSQWYPQKTASVPLALPVSIPNDPLPSGSFSFATAEVEQASIAHRPPPLPPTVDPPVNQTKYPPSLSLSSSPYQITGPTAPPLYSTAGFDMMSILVRVTSRSDPQIVLGPVDFSCSFVLVDVRRYDHPILYASPAFLKLTGYEANEVVGRNCRFLQAPDGNVSRGSQRAYTDPHAVGHIHKSLLRNNECQVNLMNYRKGGQPFLNLISIVPIPWDADSDEIRYLVGFQVDLVNQPNAILQTMKDGTYRVNYSNMMNGGPAAGLGAPEQGIFRHKLVTVPIQKSNRQCQRRLHHTLPTPPWLSHPTRRVWQATLT
ncbi:blue light receptor [Tulasnella sp. 419]|nr:blue light receptor [Tulasnella sp. 419]